LVSLVQNLAKSCPRLASLDVSRNKLKKEDCTAVSKFLNNATSLTELNLSGTKFPIDSLKDLLTSSARESELKLDLSDNNLGTQGAAIIASLPFKMNIHSLNLSDNELGDEGIAVLAEGLCSNTTLKALVLDRNFKQSSKHRQLAVDNLIKLVTSNTTLEALSIAGSNKDKSGQLRHDVLPFLYALLYNTSVTHLDISVHAMGNKGAIALARVLESNHTLASVEFDENQTGSMGFVNLRAAMRENQTMRSLPLPVIDVSQALKSEQHAAGVIQECVMEIQSRVLQNQHNSA